MNLFTFIIAATAFIVAGCAAFFSVKGIATLFAGAFVATLIMAGALEVGKLVAVSFLHRYWKDIGALLRTYLAVAVIVLMGITSLGIFGFLSAAYQDSALKYEIQTSKIENIETQISSIETEITAADVRVKTLTESRINQEQRLDTITEQIGKTMTARGAEALQESTQKLIADTNEEIKRIQTKKDDLFAKKVEYEEAILDMKISGESSKDIQTFEFVAKEFNTDLDTVAKWFILVIIFVFDPLAVALVLCYNVLILKYKKDKDTEESVKTEPPLPNDNPYEGKKLQSPGVSIVDNHETVVKPEWPQGRIIKESDEKGVKIPEPETVEKPEPPVMQVIKESDEWKGSSEEEVVEQQTETDSTEEEEPTPEPEPEPVVETPKSKSVSEPTWEGPFKPEHYNQKKN